MLISTLNLLKSNTLVIRVCEKVKAADVFGVAQRVVKAIVAEINRQWAEFSLPVVLKMIFSGLNNHSSPPNFDFIAINSILKDWAL